jgi:hypothetical protein
MTTRSPRAAILVLLAACGGGSGSSTDGTTGGHFITYTFDGVAYAGSLLATATLASNGDGGNQLGIEASDSKGDTLAIAVQPQEPSTQIAPGTFTTSAAPPLATFEFAEGSAGTWVANGSLGNGMIVITALTATDIRGTFTASMMGSGSNPGAGTGMLTAGTFDLAVP